MLHIHLHHMQVWYHTGLDYDGGIQEGFHLAKMRSYYWSFYIRVWCSGVVIWCGDFVGCSHFWPIYLSVTEFFGDLDTIDIKYQFFLCHHFLFFFRYLFLQKSHRSLQKLKFFENLQNFSLWKNFEIFVFTMFPSVPEFFIGQIFTNWQTLKVLLRYELWIIWRYQHYLYGLKIS